jgi:predicted transcriptional regulator
MIFVPYTADFEVLEVIKDHENKKLRVKDIAEITKSGHQTTNGIIRKLRQRKYITISTIDKGINKRQYTVTEKGIIFLRNKDKIIESRRVKE